MSWTMAIYRIWWHLEVCYYCKFLSHVPVFRIYNCVSERVQNFLIFPLVSLSIAWAKILVDIIENPVPNKVIENRETRLHDLKNQGWFAHSISLKKSPCLYFS